MGQPSQLDQIDLIHLAQNLGTDEANALIEALQGCIKYNRTSSTISDANGISIYFPFSSLSSLSSILDTYDEIGMDGEYSATITRFANVEAGGQAITTGSSSAFDSILSGVTGNSSSLGSNLVGTLIGSLISNADFSEHFGFLGHHGFQLAQQPTPWKTAQPIMKDNHLDSDQLNLTEKGRRPTFLVLTDDEWDLIQTIELNVFVDDGEGYIDLGLDNVFEFDNDGDLIVDFDGTWLSLDEKCGSILHDLRRVER